MYGCSAYGIYGAAVSGTMRLSVHLPSHDYVRVSPEPSEFVAVTVEGPAHGDAPLVAAMPPVLRVSRVLGFALFGLGR